MQLFELVDDVAHATITGSRYSFDVVGFGLACQPQMCSGGSRLRQ
jgi:hypothetical protein